MVLQEILLQVQMGTAAVGHDLAPNLGLGFRAPLHKRDHDLVDYGHVKPRVQGVELMGPTEVVQLDVGP